MRTSPYALQPSCEHRLLTRARRRYEVLSDSQKRSIYDTRGEAGLSESGGMGGMDPQVRGPCACPAQAQD